jgi:putative membrane protein
MRTTALLTVALGLSFAARAEEAKKGLNDPQIATIALTAHQIDIDRGKLTLKRTKNAEVKQFAEQMVNDHTAGKNEALALAKKLGVTPEESNVTKSLKADAKKTSHRLAKEKGGAFDKDYIDSEVAYHQAVIDAIKNTLIPGAQNGELKTLLQNAVPTLEGHLQHAKMVQSQVASKAEN